MLKRIVILHLICVLLSSKFVESSQLLNCPQPKVFKQRVIRKYDSEENGAVLLHTEKNIEGAVKCFNLCCKHESCNLAVMQYKKIFGSLQENCYLYDCGSPSVCSYENREGYAVIELDREKQIEVEPPPVSTTIPERETTDKLKTTKELKTTSLSTTSKNEEEKCPFGVPVAMCSDEPCQVATCRDNPKAMCKNNYCGGCHAIFYTSTGEKAMCERPEQPAPIQMKPPEEKPPQSYITDNNHNEQTVTVRMSEEGEAPKDHLFVDMLTVVEKKETSISNVTEKNKGNGDPYYQTERRKWKDFDGDDHIITKSPTKAETSTEFPVIITDVRVVQSPLVSIPLLVALIISLLLVIGLIYRIKCARRGKPKKFAVDDGDYLINGMYL